MFTLFIFILICLACGFVGRLATKESVKTWYPTLIKPRWNPPDKIFAPVWITLYVIMAVSGWMVWERLFQGYNYFSMVLFGVQLVFNIAWSVIFFGFRRPDWALVEIVFLWILILWTILIFWDIYWLSGALLLPYLLWVSFAIILNAAIVKLNYFDKS